MLIFDLSNDLGRIAGAKRERRRASGHYAAGTNYASIANRYA
jgi:hypothetical protein